MRPNRLAAVVASPPDFRRLATIGVAMLVLAAWCLASPAPVSAQEAAPVEPADPAVPETDAPTGPAEPGADPEPDGDSDADPETDPEPDPEAARRERNLAVLSEVGQALRARFYDPEAFEAKWPGIVGAHRERVAAATDRAELNDALADALAEFGVSHLGVLPEYVYNAYLASERSGGEWSAVQRMGFGMARIDGRYYCDGVTPNTPAAESGLKSGDEIVAIDGTAPGEHPDVLDGGYDRGIGERPHYVFRARPDTPIEVTWRRKADGPTTTASIAPKAYTSVAVTGQSVRVIERDGYRFGYVHTVHFLTQSITRIVRAAITHKFQDCDVLILDLRGPGGHLAVVYQIAALLGLDVGRRGRDQVIWDRPCVCLIDARARSAKEVFADIVKRNDLATLVGQRTARAVLGTVFPRLSTGDYLKVPASDGRDPWLGRAMGGRDLEGVGVEPHFHIPETPLPFSAGADPVMAGGLKVAVMLAKAEARAGQPDAGGGGAVMISRAGRPARASAATRFAPAGFAGSRLFAAEPQPR
jgi:carboxyl-terminal processing protease